MALRGELKRLVGGYLATCALGIGTVGAQSGSTACAAPSFVEEKYPGAWFRAPDLTIDSLPSLAEAAARRFAGDYLIVQVQTEGVLERSVQRWRLRLSRLEPGGRCPRGRCQTSHDRVVLTGGTIDPAGPREAKHPSLQSRLSADGEPGAWITLNRQSRALTLSVRAPGGFEGTGEIFSILASDADGFLGRWSHDAHSIGRIIVGTDTLGESERGYYCAFRVARAGGL